MYFDTVIELCHMLRSNKAGAFSRNEDELSPNIDIKTKAGNGDDIEESRTSARNNLIMRSSRRRQKRSHTPLS